MASLKRLLILSMAIASPFLLTSEARAAEADVTPPRIDAVISADHADLWRKQHFPSKRSRGSTAGEKKQVILTSYQRVCTATTKNDFAAADVCHRSSSLCTGTRISSAGKTTSTAAWVMTAPATPTPGPNDWNNTGIITCRTTTDAAAEPVITAADFRRLPIPPTKITIQPNPETSPTLINIPTNLYTNNTPTTLPTTILGQPVEVRATPTTYTWTYGDHTTHTTTNPGGPYPNLTTGHTYTHPGTYTVHLTTTYTGHYSVNNGPWQPINGTATIPSPTARITALEARNQLTR